MKLTKENIILFGWWLALLFAVLPDFNYVSITNKFIWYIVLISFYYAYKIFTSSIRYPIFFIYFSILFFILFLYGLIHLLFGENLYVHNLGRVVPKTEYLVGILQSFTPLYMCYFFIYKGCVTSKSIRIFSILFLITAIIEYIAFSDFYMSTYNVDSFTNNVGYSFIALLPLSLFWRDKPVINYIYLFIVLIFILYSNKRGAIIIGLVAISYFVYLSFKKEHKRHKLRKFIQIIISLSFLIFVIYLFYYLLENSVSYERFKSGDSSGRDVIYTMLFDSFLNENNILITLFGNGAESTLIITGTHAHNDWLELLTNQGFMGFFIYLLYFVALIQAYHRTIDGFKKQLLGICTIVMILPSIYSMSYMTYGPPLLLSLAYGLQSKKL